MSEEHLSVFVQNIKYTTTDEQLKQKFGEFGEVVDAKILTYRYHGQMVSKGSGFVTFKDAADCQKCLAAKNVELDGRPLRIAPKHARPPRAPEAPPAPEAPRTESSETPAPRPAPKKEPLKVYCGNLDYRSTADSLAKFFTDLGCDVADVKIPTEKWKGQSVSRGFGFVRFKSEGGFRKALEANGSEFDGRRLRLREAFEKRPRIRDTLFIGGVPVGTTEADLRAAFVGYNIKSVRLVRFDDGEKRGYGFVQFATEAEQDSAGKKYHEIDLKGGRSKVRWAKGRAPSTRRWRRFGGKLRAPRQVPPQSS